MKHVILFFSLFFSMSFFAQRYTTSVGLRFANVGFTQLNGKHFLNEHNAVELSLGGNSNYVWVQGNYEWQQKLTEEVDYYLGVGPGLGIVSGNPILVSSNTISLAMSPSVFITTYRLIFHILLILKINYLTTCGKIWMQKLKQSFQIPINNL